MSDGEAREVRTVARVLAGPVAAPVLPDVVQNRKAAVRCAFRDRIQERVIRASCGGKLDSDGAGGHTAIDLLERERRVVRVDRHIPTNAIGMLLGDALHRVVPARRVGR